MFKIAYYVFLFLFIAARFMPYLPAYGATTTSQAPTVPLDEAKITGILCTAMKWMFWVLILLSIIMVLAAAYMYVFSGGNPENVSKANKTILYAAIGVAVALLARGIPTLVAEFLGAQGNFDRC